MGNCIFGGLGELGSHEFIKVSTSNGGVMEFYSPTTVQSITQEFPGHAIYRNHDHIMWAPLQLHDELIPGESYHLLPVPPLKDTTVVPGGKIARSNSAVSVAPYRMSFDHNNQRALKRSYTQAFCKYNGNHHAGFWKVKLVISSDQLVEILSKDGPTQEFIESVRTVAKCGTNKNGASSNAGFSDQWSLSSSRNNTSSKNDGLLE